MDGGADTILAHGFEPDLIIGDLDSVAKDTRRRCKQKIFENPDPDRTDLDKSVGAISAPFFVAVGVLVDRIDHGLGACNVLLKYPQKKSPVDEQF